MGGWMNRPLIYNSDTHFTLYVTLITLLKPPETQSICKYK